MIRSDQRSFLQPEQRLRSLLIGIGAVLAFASAGCGKTTTKSDVKLMACQLCENAKCTAMLGGGPATWGCDGFSGVERTLCENLLNCMRTTQCSAGARDAQRCFCGSATDEGDVTCLNGGANGACRAEAEAAAGSADPREVADRFSDPTFPIGRAVNQVTCDRVACASECPL